MSLFIFYIYWGAKRHISVYYIYYIIFVCILYNSLLWHRLVWPIWFLRPTHEPVLATPNAAKKHILRGLEKMNLNGPEVMLESERKKFLAVGEACLSIFWPTPGFNRKTLNLWVLNREDFDFCIRSILLLVKKKQNKTEARRMHKWSRVTIMCLSTNIWSLLWPRPVSVLQSLKGKKWPFSASLSTLGFLVFSEEFDSATEVCPVCAKVLIVPQHVL